MTEDNEYRSPSFRDVFDQRDRDEIVLALQAKLSILESRISRLRKSERATDARLKLDEVEARRNDLQDLIRRVCEECD